MVMKKDEKGQKKEIIFFCKICDYTTSHTGQYGRHILTAKHQFRENGNNGNGRKDRKGQDFLCVCGKKYTFNSGLSRHKRLCKHNEQTSEMNLKIFESAKADDTIMKMMLEQIKNDAIVKTEMLKEMREQNKIIKELVPRIGNSQFNINVFLNEQCRDALNMSEFIDSLQIKLKDLLYTKENGLSRGISSLFVNGLKQLDTFKRPIHCTDVKRETLYIKENNEWDRENGKTKLKSAINDIANKQRKSICCWEKNNVNWNKTEEGKESYIKLIKSVMSDVYDDEENKIIKNIAKETIIEK